MNKNSPDTKFLFGFFLGGVIGALIIFFLGTKEGKKTGKLLESKGRDFLEELQDKLDDLEIQGKELAKKGEELKEQIAVQVEEKKQTISVDAAVQMDSALAHIEEIQEKGRITTANIRKKYFKNIPKK